MGWVGDAGTWRGWRVGKPLRGELAGNFSARRGPHRLRYRIEQDGVFIVRVDHRGDVYRHPRDEKLLGYNSIRSDRYILAPRIS
ncbi:type II toxin-antitoxin system RelE family toxin [Mycobacterium helveticum]|uniref:type II toxin-antitoxin system RelE family toxin n=1 Tax=Mycobacterium helveticum TaxID=2592811 RepID=UPI001FE8668E|nr:type II toxin-antitoxin system RelE/ParE family toxin [Mycobacterium helveticum]